MIENDECTRLFGDQRIEMVAGPRARNKRLRRLVCVE